MGARTGKRLLPHEAIVFEDAAKRVDAGADLGVQTAWAWEEIKRHRTVNACRIWILKHRKHQLPRYETIPTHLIKRKIRQLRRIAEELEELV